MIATKNKTLAIELSKGLKSCSDLPKSSTDRIISNYFKNETLEYWNEINPVTFDDSFQNQFIGALHCAFNKHHAFTLNPDDIWLLILQSLSVEINLNPEKYREKLVSFDGKEEIRIRHDDLVKGSSYNEWSILFPLFAEAIKSYIKDEKISGLILPNFTTSTPIDKICNEIALMDISKSYFTYVVETRCLIPVIHLEGEKEDWLTILGNLQTILPILGLNEWADKLSTIICNIIACYDGNINKSFFRNIYKYESRSGSDLVTGWITDFFPNSVFSSYKKNENGKFQKVEEIKKSSDNFRTSSFTPSLSSVPFIWEYLADKYNMTFFSGFCGFSNTEYDSIRPVKNYFISEKND